MRPLIPLFLNSGDIYPGLQSQGGSFICMLHCLRVTDSSESPLVRHLLTSWQPVWQLSRFIHVLVYKHWWGSSRVKTGIIRVSNTLRVEAETFNPNTLCPAYNEFGYNEHPAKTSRFLCIKITKMLKICLQQAPICYEHLRLHLFTFCKRDQVYSL